MEKAMTAAEISAAQKAAVEVAMRQRCEEQGHIWKRGLYVLECKWCGFRV